MGRFLSAHIIFNYFCFEFDSLWPCALTRNIPTYAFERTCRMHKTSKQYAKLGAY